MDRDHAGRNAAGPVGRLLARGVGAVHRVRPGRPLHPHGTWFRGELVRASDGGSGIAWIDGSERTTVQVRLSGGLGVPAPLPDVQGIAIRSPGASGPVDLLLASCGRGRLGWWILLPRRTPEGGFFTTLMPYRGDHGPVLVGAHVLRGPAGDGTRHLVLAWARPTGPWHRFGVLDVSVDPAGDDEDRFDPLEHVPDGAETYRWTRALREPAYARARTSPDGQMNGARTPGKNTGTPARRARARGDAAGLPLIGD